MITVPHTWTVAGEHTRRCTACGATYRLGEAAWYAPDGAGPLDAEPPCPLVPTSDHTRYPWRLLDIYGNTEMTVTISYGDYHSIATVSGTPAEQRANGTLLARAPALRDAAEATLLYHAPGAWDDERAARWRELTGADRATARDLYDFVRRCLG